MVRVFLLVMRDKHFDGPVLQHYDEEQLRDNEQCSILHHHAEHCTHVITLNPSHFRQVLTSLVQKLTF